MSLEDSPKSSTSVYELSVPVEKRPPFDRSVPGDAGDTSTSNAWRHEIWRKVSYHNKTSGGQQIQPGALTLNR
jgi:hypothetical protein